MSADTIVRSEAVKITRGLELLDSTDALIDDISDDFLGGSISRDNEASIHGTARLQVTRALSWETNRLRPYIILTDLTNGETFRWNLGVYLPETPTRRVGSTPQVFDIEAYDKLVILDTPYGSTYRVAAGAGYIATVEAILNALGLPHGINQERASSPLPSDRIWELDEKNTTLVIVNELLAAIGYRSLYVDRSGVFRSEAWVSPKLRTSVFTYDTTATDSVVLGGGLEEEADLFDIPNVWVFIRDDLDPALPLPTEGNGIYTVTNQNDGPTSINSRGRIKRRIDKIDAGSHEWLVAVGNYRVERDKQPVVNVKLRSSLNPSHWHDNAVTVTAPEVGLQGTRFTELAWELPLDGGPMSHTLRKA